MRVLTMHAEIDLAVRLAAFDALEHVLLQHGATRVWIDPASGPDLVVLAEFDEGSDATSDADSIDLQPPYSA